MEYFKGVTVRGRIVTFKTEDVDLANLAMHIKKEGYGIHTSNTDRVTGITTITLSHPRFKTSTRKPSEPKGCSIPFHLFYRG